MQSATDIDRKVGENPLKLRVFRGMTQEMLADTIGVTFQQLQKYEKGRNRTGVFRLRLLAQELGVPVSEFYDGIGGVPRSDTQADAGRACPDPKYNALPEPQKKALHDYKRFLRAHRG